MFINHKIVDQHNHLLGATGIGMEMSYIDGILKLFRENYQFTVFFINRDGRVILRERGNNPLTDLSENPALNQIKDQIFDDNPAAIEYQDQGEHYLLKTQYIPELDAYLIVQAKLDDFTQEVRQTFYANLSISLLITFIVTLVILMTIRRFNRKLEFLAQNDPLTHLKNRRAFNEAFTKYLSFARRNQQPLSLIFFDIDDFKKINDDYGHFIGDQVLTRVGKILSNRLRESDLAARWGGEEFIISLINTSNEEAKTLAEDLRTQIAKDTELQNLTEHPITISLGTTECHPNEDKEHILRRLDNAMYEAKRTGKNKTIAG